MHLTESPTEIQIRHVPILSWTTGLCAIGLGLLVLGLTFWPPAVFSTVFTNEVDYVELMFLVAFSAYVGIVEWEFKAGILAPMTTLTFNKQGRFVQVDHVRIYGKRTDRYYFRQLKKFKSRKRNHWFRSEYYLDLNPISRKSLALNVPLGKEKNEVVTLIKKLNKIILAPPESEVKVSRQLIK